MLKRHAHTVSSTALRVVLALLAVLAVVVIATYTQPDADSPHHRYLAYLKPAVEIFVFFAFFLLMFRFLRGTRGEGILKGIVTFVLAGLVVLQAVARQAELERLEVVLDRVFEVSVIVFAIVFQPELRRAFLQLGANPLLSRFIKSAVNPVEPVVEAALRLAKNKVGALIAFERETGLRGYVERGVQLDAEITSELLETIFFPGSALHDGAVIIQDRRVAAAGCLFPLTDNPSISKKLGTRHRAAIGLTEDSDAVTVCVSEETGKVSIGVGGELKHNVDAETLEAELKKLIITGQEGVGGGESSRTTQPGAAASSSTRARVQQAVR